LIRQPSNGADSYGILENRQKKYMKNANISCIKLDFVSSYCCKGMTLRHRKHPELALHPSKLRHWPPGTNNKPFVPSFLL
jgi:hypothetical protein